MKQLKKCSKRACAPVQLGGEGRNQRDRNAGSAPPASGWCRSAAHAARGSSSSRAHWPAAARTPQWASPPQCSAARQRRNVKRTGNTIMPPASASVAARAPAHCTCSAGFWRGGSLCCPHWHGVAKQKGAHCTRLSLADAHQPMDEGGRAHRDQQLAAPGADGAEARNAWRRHRGQVGGAGQLAHAAARGPGSLHRRVHGRVDAPAHLPQRVQRGVHLPQRTTRMLCTWTRHLLLHATASTLPPRTCNQHKAETQTPRKHGRTATAVT